MPVNREPWLAALLGITFPGAGHYYAGARGAGAALVAITLAVMAFSVWAFVAPSGPVAAGWAGIALLLGLLVFSAYDAHRRCARDMSPEFAAEYKVTRDAWRAVFLSALFPGLGQFYSGRALPGIAFLLAGMIAALAKDWPLVLGYVVLRGGAMHDAGQAQVLRRGSPYATARAVVAGLTLFAAGQLTLAAIVRTRLIQAFRIPSASMAPILSVGDRLFVDRTRGGRAEVGDMIAYRYPLNTALSYVHRCIAVEGQTIEIRDRVVRVDGRVLEEPYVTHVDPHVRPGDEDARDNLAPFTVPPGNVFVMGDNRDNANDSRYWGPVPTRNVLGRACKIYWPLARAGSLLGR
jgi:signal peptidase I